ncbi:MAG TPA: hypothetical protein VNO82_23655, partial [Solirubrobacteraceae bacterium]|nr:hypothetical protein [Solirubrobacteraceae bacterium]
WRALELRTQLELHAATVHHSSTHVYLTGIPRCFTLCAHGARNRGGRHRRGLDIPDPAGRPIEEVRMIRDGLEARVRDMIDNRLDAIRTDMTAHQL